MPKGFPCTLVYFILLLFVMLSLEDFYCPAMALVLLTHCLADDTSPHKSVRNYINLDPELLGSSSLDMS